MMEKNTMMRQRTFIIFDAWYATVYHTARREPTRLATRGDLVKMSREMRDKVICGQINA